MEQIIKQFIEILNSIWEAEKWDAKKNFKYFCAVYLLLDKFAFIHDINKFDAEQLAVALEFNLPHPYPTASLYKYDYISTFETIRRYREEKVKKSDYCLTTPTIAHALFFMLPFVYGLIKHPNNIIKYDKDDDFWLNYLQAVQDADCIITGIILDARNARKKGGYAKALKNEAIKKKVLEMAGNIKKKNPKMSNNDIGSKIYLNLYSVSKPKSEQYVELSTIQKWIRIYYKN